MANAFQVSWCTLLLAWCIACRALATVELIPDPPVRFLDAVSKPKYIIAIDQNGDAAQPLESPGMRTIVIADKTGRKYYCRLPAEDLNDTSNVTSEAGQVEAVAKKELGPAELLDELATLCFYRAEDWWTYELCYKKHVRQFHRQQAADGSHSVAVEYSLGEYNASATDANRVQVDTSPGQKDLKYVSQIYDGGETCDITGGKRQTEVRYSCGEGAKDLITSIKEPSTCHYVMNVRTPRLCQHRKFRVDQEPVAHILCSVVPYQFKTEMQEPSDNKADDDIAAESGRGDEDTIDAAPGTASADGADVVDSIEHTSTSVDRLAVADSPFMGQDVDEGAAAHIDVHDVEMAASEGATVPSKSADADVQTGEKIQQLVAADTDSDEVETDEL